MAHNTTDPLPPPLLRALREWGPRWHHDIGAGRDAMLDAWAPALARAPASTRVATDLAYGPDPRQVLDIHAPPGAVAAPVLVFVHGGAFIRGDKCMTDRVYANVVDDFARHGFVAVNVEYRLAPAAAWPEGACDVAAALVWVRRQIGRWGGDPARIVLMAHSAAASHCASALWDPRVAPDARDIPVGLILVSPRVAADQRPENPNAHGVRAYYGDDVAQYDDRSPMYRVRPDAPPTFVVVAQYENPLLEYQGFELAHRLARVADRDGGPMPRFLQVPDHNHMSIVIQFDTPHDTLGADLRDWIARVLRGEFAARAGARI